MGYPQYILLKELDANLLEPSKFKMAQIQDRSS